MGKKTALREEGQSALVLSALESLLGERFSIPLSQSFELPEIHYLGC